MATRSAECKPVTEDLVGNTTSLTSWHLGREEGWSRGGGLSPPQGHIHSDLLPSLGILLEGCIAVCHQVSVTCFFGGETVLSYEVTNICSEIFIDPVVVKQFKLTLNSMQTFDTLYRKKHYRRIL